MSDRLAVLARRQGRCRSARRARSTPQPATSYVATFLGTTNLFSATVTAVDADGLTCTVGATTLSVGPRRARPRRRRRRQPDGPPRTRRDHPLRRHLGPGDAERTNIVPGKVVALTFRGAHTGVLLDCSGLGLEAEVANIRGEPPHWLTTGSAVRAKVSPAALRLLVS